MPSEEGPGPLWKMQFLDVDSNQRSRFVWFYLSTAHLKG